MAGLAEATDPDAAGYLADALAACGVKDDAVLAALLAAFGSFPGELASALGEYGDARALPPLARYLDDHIVGEGETPQDEEGCITAAECDRRPRRRTHRGAGGEARPRVAPPG
jgi:hypothetical protein